MGKCIVHHSHSLIYAIINLLKPYKVYTNIKSSREGDKIFRDNVVSFRVSLCRVASIEIVRDKNF